MSKNKNIIKHYNLLIDKYGISKSGLGWTSNKQNERFSIFLKHLYFKDKIVFDFGCGKSDFFDFLRKIKQKPKMYFCSEINPFLIRYLKKKFNKKKKVIVINEDIVQKKTKFNAQISISNGVHNFKHIRNSFFFLRDIRYLFSKSKEAVGLSFLNDQVDYKEKHLKYHKFNQTINELKKISHNMIVDQTFSKYETFIIIYK